MKQFNFLKNWRGISFLLGFYEIFGISHNLMPLKSPDSTTFKPYSVTAISLKYSFLRSVQIQVSSAYWLFSSSNQATQVFLSATLYYSWATVSLILSKDKIYYFKPQVATTSMLTLLMALQNSAYSAFNQSTLSSKSTTA